MTACPAGVGCTPSAAQYCGAPFFASSSNAACSGTKLAPACCATRRAALRRSSNSGNQRSSTAPQRSTNGSRSEEHTSELQSQSNLVCRLLLEKKKTKIIDPCVCTAAHRVPVPLANRTDRLRTKPVVAFQQKACPARDEPPRPDTRLLLI